MKALMIKDLSRNDELTVEEMETIKGGFAVWRRLDETYEPASGAVDSNSIGSVIGTVGQALSTVARKQ
jgi:hypothetical protein